MIVRRCTIADIDLVYKIEEEAFSDSMKKETMQKDLERESYFCYALFDESMLAFISFEKVFDEGQIISIATDSEHRQKGLAKKLFYEVEKLAKKEGIELFTLEVRSDNYPAIRLYEALGFEKVGLRKNYYQNPDSDAILMDLHIEKD
ncbi:MAG: ribosomal protein S18-alanine N-acetyltransferase [Clostridia bacterium]|nr:ribosomal protein S18-alanine N-acetyltransferase [Clostridia bacterium]